MPSGYPSPITIPCDGCSFRRQCARSAWVCVAFNRYVGNLTWKTQQRGPSIEATQQAIAERQHARQVELAEERRASRRAIQNRWRARNSDYVRAQRRKYAPDSYQRMKADPARWAAMLERQRHWRREHAKETYQRLRADPVRWAAAQERKRRWASAKRAEKKVPAAAAEVRHKQRGARGRSGREVKAQPEETGF